jgi:hypothetical protein
LDRANGETTIYCMLTLVTVRQGADRLYYCEIQGRRGRIAIHDLVWVVDRQDLLEIYYWEAVMVLDGGYHCCLSVPGKVVLLNT